MEEKKKMRMVVEEVGDTKEEVKPAEEIKTEKPQIKEEVKKEPSFNILWILIPGMLLLGLLIGGIFAYFFGIQKIADINRPDVAETQNTTVEPTPASTALPESSPSANLSKYKIKILNGSGIKGEAGKVQALVEGAGFSVLSAGNAATYDYTKTQITLKTGIDSDFVTALVTALAKNYQLDDPKTLSTQTNDVTVTVGSLKAI